MPVLTENGSYVYAIDEHGTPHDEWVNAHEPNCITNIPSIESWNLKPVPFSLGVVNCSNTK